MFPNIPKQRQDVVIHFIRCGPIEGGTRTKRLIKFDCEEAGGNLQFGPAAIPTSLVLEAKVHAADRHFELKPWNVCYLGWQDYANTHWHSDCSFGIV
jgi:hypothetical protein